MKLDKHLPVATLLEIMITDVANKNVFDVFFYKKEASASPLTLTAFHLLTKQVLLYCPQNLTIFYWVKVL
jgi:hypothetical protein